MLDVGTGTGFAALIAAALGHRVTGIDLSENMIAVARTQAMGRGVHITLIIGDAVEPPVEGESHFRRVERRGALQMEHSAVAFPPLRAAKTP